MIGMPEKDKNIVIDRYSQRYEKYGYSPKTLGWDKGKQDIRYKMLLENFNLEGKSILDIGCGFGDANKTLKKLVKNYTYIGIDIVEKLIIEAKKNYANQTNISFILEDFLKLKFEKNYDIIISSGVFNFKLQEADNYEFIKSFMDKAFNIANDGIAFDFLSDKVDFQYKHTFHSNPTNILNMAYNMSRNIMLKNNYMPFEFTVVVFKDQSFLTDDTIFTRFKNEK